MWTSGTINCASISAPVKANAAQSALVRFVGPDHIRSPRFAENRSLNYDQAYDVLANIGVLYNSINEAEMTPLPPGAAGLVGYSANLVALRTPEAAALCSPP